MVLQGHECEMPLGHPNQDITMIQQIRRAQPILGEFKNDIIHRVITNKPVPVGAATFLKIVIQFKGGFRKGGFITAVHGNFNAGIKPP